MNDKRPQSSQDNSTPYGYTHDQAYTGIAMFLIAAAVVIFFIIIKLQPPTRDANHHLLPPEKLDPVKEYWAIKGTVGDFTAGVVGTIFSLAAFSMIYLSFKKQREANETQNKMFDHEKVESRFFELVNIHRENVGELKFDVFQEKGTTLGDRIGSDVESVEYEKRQYFLAVIDQFKSLNTELDVLFRNYKEGDIYTPEYHQRIKNNKTIADRKIDLLLFARIDIVYLIIFFGVGADGKSTIESLVKGRYKTDTIQQLIYAAALKPNRKSHYWLMWYVTQVSKNKLEIITELIKAHKGEQFNTKVLGGGYLTHGSKNYPYTTIFYQNDYVKFYGGHQFRLGHYFRHLFQTVSFINDNEKLTAKKQYGYIRHLRGQLSTGEQILIFLNSLSQLGRAWELEDKKTGLAIEEWNCLISDYMLIKNIPSNEIITGVSLDKFYPNIKYEGFDTHIQSPKIDQQNL